MIGILFFTVLAAVLLYLLSGITVAIMGVAGLLGVVSHEAVHGIVAVARRRTITDVGWDRRGPYVEYESDDVDAVIQLAPSVVGVCLLGPIVATTPYPALLAPVSFAITLAVAPLDWLDVYDAMQRNAL